VFVLVGKLEIMPSPLRELASDAAAPDRRTRLRAWTRAEIKAAAWRQLAEHGVEGLSLNAIAKELGMTGPALYRYIASRDELLTDLVVDAWDALADAVERAAEEHAGASAAKRLGAIGLCYRGWAVAQPHRYRLAVQTRLGLEGFPAIPAAQRSWVVILDAIEDLPDARRPTRELPADLRAQLDAWTEQRRGQQRPPAVLLRGVLLWSRLHGLITLELDRHLAEMQLDPELLYRAELADLGAET
jgi:AcrR family transcriptional regulator